MKSFEIRKSFLDHFEGHNHELIKSSSLVPHNDPTLLFNNAGMNQFKGVFLGQEAPPASRRATTSQKCVRAGGKHNDLENVGFTARHHTFFEMLGNFSFGDYFKEEALIFAWELLTKKWGLDERRLYVTVYDDDDEAAELWHKVIGVSKDKIYRFGQKDNFWRMGDTGPCGPCSEIFYDQGDRVGGNPKDNVMGGEGDRFIEIWNLVFMQYFEDESGKLTPLPRPSIDTGMGLERISAIMQGQINNYNSDLFLPLIDVASKISKTTYSLAASTDNKEAAALRVIADHARAVSFLLADGVIPSNEGRGYVLRRILRRAIRYARTLTDQSVLPEVCKKVIITMNDVYPELQQSKEFILKSVTDEQERFLETLDKGTELLKDEIQKVKSRNAKALSGEFVFKLYDTFGFPADLTQLMAKEDGIAIDEKSFEDHLQMAKERSKSNRKDQSFKVSNAEVNQLATQYSPTQFLGYETLETAEAQAIAFFKIEEAGLSPASTLNSGEEAYVLFDRTPFYAEGGGQVADLGTGSSSSGAFNVLDVQKYKDVFFHRVEVARGSINSTETFSLHVDGARRAQIAAHHSATHLLHFALRQVLGTHVKQAGSLVAEDKLRFDFTNKGPLTSEQKQLIEQIVNSAIKDAEQVSSTVSSYNEALEAGALALFGEKYGDTVRVIKMADSVELCGGTHVHNLADIKYFKIVSETGVSSGVRRIEALAGTKAIEMLDQKFSDYKKICSELKLSEDTHAEAVIQTIEKFKAEISDLKKKLKSAAQGSVSVDDIVKNKVTLDSGLSYIFYSSDIDDTETLRTLVDQLKNKLGSGIVVVTGAVSEKTPLIVSVDASLNRKAPAGQILKSIAEKHGGRGGGRPDFAQGAVSDVDNITQTVNEVIASILA